MQIFSAIEKVVGVIRARLGPLFMIVALLVTVAQPAVAQAQSGTLLDKPADLIEGEVMRVEDGEVRQLAFSPDEATLAVATSAGLWIYGPSAASNGQLLDKAPVQALWWSPDGNLLAALLEDGALQIWQMTERESTITLSSTDPFASVAWAPDSTQLATGSTTGVIELWALGTGQQLETLEGHADRVSALYWVKDGSQLVSAAADGSVRAWQIEVAASALPTPTPTPTPRSPITATILTDVLNIRSGPATTFEKLGNVKRGEIVPVLDQSGDCAWYEIKTAAGLQGWVNGNPSFIALNGECTAINAAAVAPKPPAAAALPQPTPTPTPTIQSAVAPTAQEPTPTPTAALATATPASAVDPFPLNKGCFLFQNQLGPELTVTVTAKEGNFTENFKIGDSKEVPYCLDPGRYTYTIDAPPPWADINGELDVKAGDRFMFPIRAQ